MAILYPTRAALADALRRLIVAGIPSEGASDHGVSEALYLSDPDGNGVELYRDRPEAEWPRPADGSSGVAMYSQAIDLEDLLKEAPVKPATEPVLT
jgi:catechol 2,3-dioxygenase